MGTPDFGDINVISQTPARVDVSPLGQIIARINRALESGDYAEAGRLIENDMLVAWYGFSPDRLFEVLSTLVANGAAGGGLIPGMLRFMSGIGESQQIPESELQPSPVKALAVSTDHEAGELRPLMNDSYRIEMFGLSARLFELRLEGRAVEALQVSRRMQKRTGMVRPIFDPHGGLGLFSAVQHGITAMLAGDFSEALESFARAQTHVLLPPLAFLTRDAYLRQGVIDAL